MKNYESFWTTNDDRVWDFGVAFAKGCFTFSFGKRTWTVYKEQNQ